jgi:hypothetical protein
MTSLTGCGRIMYQSMKHKSTSLQEDVMNKKQTILAVLMIFALTNLSQAQTFFPVLKKYSAADKERIDQNYVISLNSNNHSIVESALAVVTMLKLDLPADEFPMVSDRIEYLASHGDTPMIRYRASLACAVFANPDLFKEQAALQYNDTNTLFSALADGSDKPILSSK